MIGSLIALVAATAVLAPIPGANGALFVADGPRHGRCRKRVTGGCLAASEIGPALARRCTGAGR